MDKKKDHAFGKDVYLLGKNQYDEYLWLEEGSWDCEWYWGFGYVETYTNNKNPGLSRDISSHSHFDGLVGFKRDDNNYVHHLNESPKMNETVLTESESWELADLMKSFYTLRETAGIYNRGNSHLATTKNTDLKNKEAWDRINKKEIPVIMKRIYEILSPIGK